MFLKKIDFDTFKIPKSFIKDYNKLELNKEVNVDLNDETIKALEKIAQNSQTDLNTAIGYFLTHFIMNESEKIKDYLKKYNLDEAMLIYDLEIMNEDKLAKLIETKKILLLDVKLNKVGVSLPYENYEKIVKKTL